MLGFEVAMKLLVRIFFARHCVSFAVLLSLGGTLCTQARWVIRKQ